MELVVSPSGNCRCVYDETIDLTLLGQLTIRRGSHVELTDDGRWLADLSVVDGPILGPFPLRSQALTAERTWLERHWLLRAD